MTGQVAQDYALTAKRKRSWQKKICEDTLRAIKPQNSLLLLEDITLYSLCVLIESLKYLNRLFSLVQDFFLFYSGGIISWVQAFLTLGSSGNIKRYVLIYKISIDCHL